MGLEGCVYFQNVCRGALCRTGRDPAPGTEAAGTLVGLPGLQDDEKYTSTPPRLWFATAAQADGHAWGSLLPGAAWPDSGGQAQTMNRGTGSSILSGRELKTLSLSQPHAFWGMKEQENARKSKISKRQSKGKGDASREKQEKWAVSAQATCLPGCRWERAGGRS